MKMVIYVILIAGSLLIPVQKQDVANLQPVEAVFFQNYGDRIKVKTDTGAKGEGKDINAAIHDLKATTPEIIYLDTAQYLLIDECNQEQIEQIKIHLKKRVKVYAWDGKGEIRDVVRFLSARENQPD